MSASIPEWVPKEYDPDAPLRERLPIIAGIEGGIEIHVTDEHGTTEIVGSPKHFTETEAAGTMELSAGMGNDDSRWKWEIFLSADDEASLFRVNPNQSMEAYMATRKRWMENVDVRMYGVDAARNGGNNVE